MMAVFLLLLKLWIPLLAMLPDVHTQSDPCDLPCQNGANCVTNQQGKQCDCPPDYTGNLCEENIDHCSFPIPHECQHNSQCVDGVGNYTCACLSGWEGNFCEKEKNECESKPCQNDGNCTDKFDGFLCNCTSNYTGPMCAQDVDECSQNPQICKNGASCENYPGGFNCACAAGYNGPLCEKEINECESSPCHFNGTCIDLVNNFRCKCLPGFLGNRCEAVIKECSISEPCGKNGICVDKPEGGYQCFCKPGYNGKHCEYLVNLCIFKPCRNGATCVNNGVNYTCSCVSGFTGKNCETDIKECASAPCLNNGTCQEPVPGGFSCQCLAGFFGNKCEVDINECESNPCQGRQTCVDLVNNYRCECPIGTVGILCEQDVFDCRLTSCVNGGNCSKGEEAYVCSCPSPFTDPTCATSLDPCTPNPCLYGGQCYRVNETEFGCVCADGYMGPRCEADVYDCLSNPCLNGGTCEEVIGNKNGQNITEESQSSGRAKFICLCPDDFTGKLCEMKFLACLSSPCKNGATCTSQTKMDYTCECNKGWAGAQCDKDINECLNPSPVCLNNGQCLNRSPGFSCVCPQHWTGMRCDVEVLECTAVTCLNGGTCTEITGNTSSCICPAGYTGANCSMELSHCEPNPCQNNATCQDHNVTNNTGGRQNFTCQCQPGFTGPLCDANIDECTLLKPCSNNATCHDAINNYTCECQAGWTGPTCEENIDECLSGPCKNGGNCTDMINGFTCKCLFNYAGDTCTDVNECVSSPCYGSATCVDGINNFTCICSPGFQGSLCEVDIKECSSNPCKYGGTCTEPRPGIFSCLCPPGVEGDNCQIISTSNFNGRAALTFSSLIQISNGGSGQRSRVTRDTAPSGSETQLQFTVTTTVLDGILLVTTGISSFGLPQHIALELRNSVLHLSTSNGFELFKDTLDLTSNNVSIHIHLVQLTIQDGGLNLRVNPTNCKSGAEDCLSLSFQFANMTSWNLNGAVHFGGVAEFTPYLRHLVQDISGFTGCLANLMVNGRLINLAVASEFTLVSNISNKVPEYGCATHIPCLEGACANGGTCQDLWVNKTCHCVPGYSGPTCSFQNMAHFETNSMLHFEMNLVITEISFFFTAANASGLILYTVTMDSLSFSLENGQLVMRLILYNSGRTLSSKLSSNLHLQDWVKVSFLISNSMYTIEVSSETSGSLGAFTGTTGDSVLVTGSIFWGALLNSPVTDKWRGGDMPLPTQSLRGCIRDVIINRVPLNLSFNSTYSNKDQPKPRPGCSKEEACLTTSCLNGASCVANWMRPTCKCEENYTGENCSQASASTFNGKSSYSLLILDRTMLSFGQEGKIEFRTREIVSTLILLQFLTLKGEADNFIEFRVKKGKLQVYSSFSKNTVESNRSESDGQWHFLDWVRDGSNLTLNLDNNLLHLQAGFDPYLLTLNKSVQVFIGARPYSPGNTSSLVEFFKGCMRGLSFDNVSIPYSTNGTNHVGLTIHPVGIVHGCQGDKVCGINTCPANSYCVDEWNSFVCSCLEGWEGVNCSNSVDDCKNNSCINGGMCEDKHLSYKCQCGQNFTGQFCETRLEACNVNSCITNNTDSCFLINATNYLCTCLPGYTGKICDVLIDNCESHPCLNNATCASSVNNFTCDCQAGFYGAVCEMKDYCYSLPCFNGGTCLLNSTFNKTTDNNSFTHSSNFSQNNVENTTAQTNSTNQSFICQCVKPYFGVFCQSYDYCNKNKCINNSTCVLELNNYSCKCQTGFYGAYCENKDYCVSTPCLNGGSCKNSANNYTCLCSDYFTGNHCETLINQCLSNPCLNGAACYLNVSTSSSKSSSSLLSNDSAVCVCKKGYTGQHCETEIGECASGPCLNNGSCVDSSSHNFSEILNGSFRCLCVPGFQGGLCEEDINECNSEPCQNGGVCSDLINNFTCSCREGFSGRTCNLDLRECSSSPCQSHATCDKTDANYTCLCSPGFTGTHCEEDINDCLDHQCVNGGTCKDGINNYTCNCLSGYSGQYCTNITDSCYTQPCIHGGVCSYQGLCSCPDIITTCGWYNESCQRQQCAQKQGCTQLSPSYLCNCSGTGYTGLHCNMDVDECSLPQFVCEHGGTCLNTVGSYRCDCANTGYHGTHCEIDNDECSIQNPCFNGGTCINTPGSFECNCSSKWEGQTCGKNKNDCQSNSCLNEGQCIQVFGNYVCNCTNTGYEGLYCSQNVDDCVNNRCGNGGQCIDGVRQYSCNCSSTGYTGQFCQTKPTSCAPTPCHNNGTCTETTDVVICNCTGTGYSGALCESDIDECKTGSHGCQGGSLCVNMEGSYLCQCRDSQTGKFCESTLTLQNAKSDLSDGALAAIIVISTLFIIVIIIAILLFVRRRRKTRGRYKPAQVEGQVRNGNIRMNRFPDNTERVI